MSTLWATPHLSSMGPSMTAVTKHSGNHRFGKASVSMWNDVVFCVCFPSLCVFAATYTWVGLCGSLGVYCMWWHLRQFCLTLVCADTHTHTHARRTWFLCWSTEVTGASFPALGGAFIAGLSVTAQWFSRMPPACSFLWRAFCQTALRTGAHEVSFWFPVVWGCSCLRAVPAEQGKHRDTERRSSSVHRTREATRAAAH